MEIPRIRVEHIQPGSIPISLEAADSEEIAPFWPLDASITRFVPTKTLEYYDSPSELLEVFSVDGEQGPVWSIGIEEERRRRIVGVIGLEAIQGNFPRVSTYILDPEAQGRGIGTTAKVSLGAYASEIALERVRSQTLTVNLPGMRSLEKSGFVRLPDPVGVETFPYGEGSLRSSWTHWTMIPPHGSEPPFALGAEAQQIARERFIEAQAAYQISID